MVTVGAVVSASNVTVLSVLVEAVLGLPAAIAGRAGGIVAITVPLVGHAADRDVVGRAAAGDVTVVVPPAVPLSVDVAVGEAG